MVANGSKEVMNPLASLETPHLLTIMSGAYFTKNQDVERVIEDVRSRSVEEFSKNNRHTKRNERQEGAPII